MLLVSLISYVDRSTLAILAPTILKETGLNGEQYGFIILLAVLFFPPGNSIGGRIIYPILDALSTLLVGR